MAVSKSVEMVNNFIETAMMEIVNQEMDVVLLAKFNKDGLVSEDQRRVKVNAII